MPFAMRNAYTHMNDHEKLVFLLSGMKVTCTAEWPELFQAIARWVYTMYGIRCTSYCEFMID